MIPLIYISYLQNENWKLKAEVVLSGPEIRLRIMIAHVSSAIETITFHAFHGLTELW